MRCGGGVYRKIRTKTGHNLGMVSAVIVVSAGVALCTAVLVGILPGFDNSASSPLHHQGVARIASFS